MTSTQSAESKVARAPEPPIPGSVGETGLGREACLDLQPEAMGGLGPPAEADAQRASGTRLSSEEKHPASRSPSAAEGEGRGPPHLLVLEELSTPSVLELKEPRSNAS